MYHHSHEGASPNFDARSYDFRKEFNSISGPGMMRYLKHFGLDVPAETEDPADFHPKHLHEAHLYRRQLWSVLKAAQWYFEEGLPHPEITTWSRESAVALTDARLDDMLGATADEPVDIDGAVRLGTELARKRGLDVGPEAVAYAVDRLKSKLERDAVGNPVGDVYSGLLSYRRVKEESGGGEVVYLDAYRRRRERPEAERAADQHKGWHEWWEKWRARWPQGNPLIDTLNCTPCGSGEQPKQERAEAESKQERAEQAKAEQPKEAWPNPEPLPNPLLPVAEFEIELLPKSLRRWVEDTSYRMQCPVDFVGVSLVNLLGSVIGRKIGIRPKQQDDWTEFANLWGIIVARPGEKKSPAMDAVLSFQARLIAQAAEKHAEALKAYQKEFKKYELIKGAKEAKAKALAKKAVESGDDDFDLDDSLLDDSEPPVRPSIRRYATNDATYEKLADLHVANPNGLMVHQDEMIALMRKLDNPDNADWRAFALTGWGGKSSHTVDRIGRGTQTIPHVCLSLFGATQPERLAAYVRPAITGSEDDDGLCQRFQLMVWPDADKPWVYVDQWPDTAAKNEVLAVVKWLDALDPVRDADAIMPQFGSTPFKQFGDDAQALWIEWSTKLHNRLKEGLLGRAMASHLSKYEKLVAALALIFHLVDCATTKLAVDRAKPISRAQLSRAITFSDYLESHAERVYSSGAFSVVEAAKLIHKRIIKGALRDGFSARDIYRAQWSGLTDNDLVNEAVELLADLNWIRQRPVNNRNITRGATYSINPAVMG